MHLEDLAVGVERDLGAGALRLADRLELGGGLAALVPLVVDLAVAAHLDLEPFAQRVDARHADAVQAAGNLVAVVVELAAGVQHGQHDLDGRLLLRRVHVHGNAAAVVVDRHRPVGVDDHLDVLAVAGQRLVDGVVDDLVDAVMQAAHAGVADVHRGALADRVHAVEDRDRFGVVLVTAAPCSGAAVGKLSAFGSTFPTASGTTWVGAFGDSCDSDLSVIFCCFDMRNQPSNDVGKCIRVSLSTRKWFIV